MHKRRVSSLALALSNYGSISWGCPKSYAPGSFEVTWGHVEEGISHRGTGQHPAVPGSSRQHQLLLFLWTSSLLLRFWILKLETTGHQTHSGHRWLALKVKGASGLNSLWFTFSFYSRKPSHISPLSIVRWVTVECTAVNPGQTLYPPFCDSHSWVKEEEYLHKDSVIVGENLKLEAIPGSEPRFCTFYISDLDTLLHLSEPYFTEFVHWWWSPFLLNKESWKLAKTPWTKCLVCCLTHTDARHIVIVISLLTYESECQRDAEVAVAEPASLSLFSSLVVWDIQTALSHKSGGRGRLCCLSPIILWNVPTRKALLWVELEANLYHCFVLRLLWLELQAVSSSFQITC